MTRTDWGEGFTYTGNLDEEYYMTWQAERLSEYIDDLVVVVASPSSHESMVEHYIVSLRPILDAMEKKAQKYLEEVSQVRELIAYLEGPSPGS